VLIRLQLTIDWLMKSVCNQTNLLDWQKGEKGDGQTNNDACRQSIFDIASPDVPKVETQSVEITSK
jgi:hypothetical protein